MGVSGNRLESIDRGLPNDASSGPFRVITACIGGLAETTGVLMLRFRRLLRNDATAECAVWAGAESLLVDYWSDRDRVGRRCRLERATTTGTG